MYTIHERNAYPYTQMKISVITLETFLQYLLKEKRTELNFKQNHIFFLKYYNKQMQIAVRSELNAC